jgi:hypothetical protein
VKLEPSFIEARTWHVKYVNDPKIARDAANSDLASPQDLILLASSQHIFVREAVAQNPHTPVSVLNALFPSKLKTEDDFRLARSIIYNRVHGAEFILATILMIKSNILSLERLDYYSRISLIQTIAKHPHVKSSDIALLLDPNSIPRYLRHRISEVATREDILIKLSQDPAARVRARPTKRLEILRKDRAQSLKTQPEACS